MATATMTVTTQTNNGSNDANNTVDNDDEKFFFSKEFLLKHIESIIDFYSKDGRVVDNNGINGNNGGYYQSFLTDGTIIDREYRHLVSSARMVINFFTAGKLLKRQDLIEIGKHGLNYLETKHYNKETDSYVFSLRNDAVEDETEYAYAYAFVLAAHAAAVSSAAASDVSSSSSLSKIYDLIEKKFWLGDEIGAYRETPHGCEKDDDYRGQNSNMHMCEAMIAAYEATNDVKYLNRAKLLANTFTDRLLLLCNEDNSKYKGFVWEHYDSNFNIDLDYNKNDPTNIYRPWGFQPGHQSEWAKNLLNIYRYDNKSEDTSSYVERAESLLNSAWELSWDDQFGGLVYGYDDELNWSDNEKYFWVQSETMATIALLWDATKNEKYKQMYLKVWKYAWKHWIDHKYGGWIAFKMTRENTPCEKPDENGNITKAIAGGKCDYHSMMACVEAMRAF